MANEHSIDDTSYFKVEPDFAVVRRYLYKGWTDTRFNKFVKAYREAGSSIHCYFIGKAQGEALVKDLSAVIRKYQLEDHGKTISYMFLTTYKKSFINATEYRSAAKRGAIDAK